MKDATAPTDQLLYSIEQTSLLLGSLSRSKVYEEIAAGRLRVVKIGSRTFTTRGALEDYVRLASGADAA